MQLSELSTAQILDGKTLAEQLKSQPSLLLERDNILTLASLISDSDTHDAVVAALNEMPVLPAEKAKDYEQLSPYVMSYYAWRNAHGRMDNDSESRVIYPEPDPSAFSNLVQFKQLIGHFQPNETTTFQACIDTVAYLSGQAVELPEGLISLAKQSEVEPPKDDKPVNSLSILLHYWIRDLPSAADQRLSYLQLMTAFMNPSESDGFDLTPPQGILEEENFPRLKAYFDDGQKALADYQQSTRPGQPASPLAFIPKYLSQHLVYDDPLKTPLQQSLEPLAKVNKFSSFRVSTHTKYMLFLLLQEPTIDKIKGTFKSLMQESSTHFSADAKAAIELELGEIVRALKQEPRHSAVSRILTGYREQMGQTKDGCPIKRMVPEFKDEMDEDEMDKPSIGSSRQC